MSGLISASTKSRTVARSASSSGVSSLSRSSRSDGSGASADRWASQIARSVWASIFSTSSTAMVGIVCGADRVQHVAAHRVGERARAARPRHPRCPGCAVRCRAAATWRVRVRSRASRAGEPGGRRPRAPRCRRRRRPRARPRRCEPSSQHRSRAGSPTRSSCQPSTPVTSLPAKSSESADSEPLITVGWNCQSWVSSVAALPAGEQRRGNEAGGGGAVDDRDAGAQALERAQHRQAGVGDEAGRQARGWRRPRARWMTPSATSIDDERHLGAVDEFVDDRAGAVDGGLAGEGGDREVQAGAHPGAEGAQGDQVGGLLRLGALIRGHADEPVLAVATGEQGAVEAAAGATERRGFHEVEPGHGRRWRARLKLGGIEPYLEGRSSLPNIPRTPRLSKRSQICRNPS